MVTLGLWCSLCTFLIPSVWPSDVISRGLYADPSKARKTSEHDFYFRYKKINSIFEYFDHDNNEI